MSVYERNAAALNFGDGVLPLDGSEAMTGDLDMGGNRILVGDGTEALPGVAFDDDTDTGIYRSGGGIFNLVSNGTQKLRIGTSTNHSYQNFDLNGNDIEDVDQIVSDDIPTASDASANAMGIIGGATQANIALTGTQSFTTGGNSPGGIRRVVDGRRAGALAIATISVDVNDTTAGWGVAYVALAVAGTEESDVLLVDEAVMNGGRLVMSKTWHVALPTSSSITLQGVLYKTIAAGSVTANTTHSGLSVTVFG